MSERVCAVVVTYNRKELLRECLEALLGQTRKVDHILVVDNASTDGTEEMLKAEFPQVEILRLPENQGCTRGFYEGMKRAYEMGFDWLWLMDDDGKPAKDCLEHLLARAGQAAVLVPVQVDSLGRRYGAGYWRVRHIPAELRGDEGVVKVELFTFVGPLLHRTVCRAVGYPPKDFFIGFDDWEYSMRIRRAGFSAIAVKEAIIYHEYGGKTIIVRRFGRTVVRYPQQPAWRHYYDSRNNLLMLRNLNVKDRFLSLVWFFMRQLYSTLEDLVYEPNWRERIWYRWLGILHGLTGLTGKRVDPN